MEDENILLYQERIGCSIEVLAKDIQNIIKNAVKDPLVSWRVKDPETLRKKIILKDAKDVFALDDVYGVRILVETPLESYTVLKRIALEYKGYLDHDYIETPKVNTEGEKLRLLQFIAYRNEVPFEIQITTYDFHAINEPCHDKYHRKRYGN